MGRGTCLPFYPFATTGPVAQCAAFSTIKSGLTGITQRVINGRTEQQGVSPLFAKGLMMSKLRLATRSFIALFLLLGVSPIAHADPETTLGSLPKELAESIRNLPKELGDLVIGDLDLLASMRGSSASPLNEKVFDARSVDGASYIRFLTDRLKTFGVEDPEDRCGGDHGVACLPYKTHTMQIAPGYSRRSQIERISVLIHEARHAESSRSNWKHATCPTDLKSRVGKDMSYIGGKPGCDDFAMGSYSVQVIFLKNVANHCENCTADVRQGAKALADDLIVRVIDEDAQSELDSDQ